MAQPRVLILRAPGTNCDRETAFAFESAGAQADRVHINRLLEQPSLAAEYQILCIPGGFSYGDDIAAGRILGNQLKHHLVDVLHAFKDQGKLILGICNGYQVLLKSGMLLPEGSNGQTNGAGPLATLDWNASARYEDRWVHLTTTSSKCVFLQDIETMYLPVAHAEGRFVTRDAETLDMLAEGGQLVLRYCDDKARSDQPLEYPLNPNGSMANVAGICDPSGQVLGLMPHPERYIQRLQHPRWTRESLPEAGDGFKLFQNAVAAFA
jgi:phosphoribosylformylglycinamidine synthase